MWKILFHGAKPLRVIGIGWYRSPLGKQDFGGLPRWGGNVDLESGVSGPPGELYPIGVEAIYVVVYEEDPWLGAGGRWAGLRELWPRAGTCAAMAGAGPEARLEAGERRNVGVKPLVLTNDGRHGETGLYAGTRHFSEALADIGPRLDQGCPSLCQGFGVLWRNDGAGLAENGPRIAYVGDNRRDATSHGFRQGVREGLTGRAGRCDVERVDYTWDIVAAPQKEAGISHARCLGPILQVGISWGSAFSAENEPRVGELLVEYARCFKESLVIFHRVLSGDVADQ